MPARHQSVPHAQQPRHARGLKSHNAVRGIALAAVALVVFGASSAVAVAQRLQSNITTVDVSGLTGPRPSSMAAAKPGDPNAGQPVNILVMGSDTRAGVNASIGGNDSGQRSDTAIVVHISADRSRVELVSIPRDSLVKIPVCQATNGKSSRASSSAMFNSAFATGWDMGGDMASAAACAIKTVQQNTGVAIDHFAVVDFAGFQAMVNAIGGVPMCIPHALHDTYSGLDLPAGQQVLNGQQALELARARHGNVGDGGDLDRIGNQQRLIQAMVNEVLSKKVLTNVPNLVSFLSAATSSLTTDSGLQLQNLTGLAYNLRNINRDNVVFMTIPTGPAPSDPNRLVWTSAAAAIWANMAADKPILQEAAQPTPTTASTPAKTSAAGTKTSAAGGAKSGTATPPAAAATPAAPAPSVSKAAGHEAFTSADNTGSCS
ncbi:LCP family protein [Cellulomonas sp. NTE-D12]|uniref:LCP family protein n=1 Tax=Cellulomonas sp. NTE-D12 TaxID=2962632 RepID=UPI00308137AD|nr:hypothetical protein CELD12_23640 [Cellulomonas sp. NTE-D12]